MAKMDSMADQDSAEVDDLPSDAKAPAFTKKASKPAGKKKNRAPKPITVKAAAKPAIPKKMC